ncbi:MAG: helix-turn-helix domain-containing protein [Dehalococcoidia bacterium]
MVQSRPAAATAVRLNGPALRTIRELRGVSCTALARAVGADHSFLARVERGEKRGVREATFVALVRELRLSDPRAILADPFASVATSEPTANDVIRLARSTGKPRAA